MHAIVIDAPGAQPHLVEVDDPVPASGQLLVRVERSSVNGYDVAVARGRLRRPDAGFPKVLGRDFAGIVAAVGPDAERFAVGEEVFGVVLSSAPDTGAFSELVAIDESSAIVPLPDGVEDTLAGALGVAGCAALTVVDALDPQPGEVVLVIGATGGVGTLAVQLLVGRGAEVVATGSGADAADVLSVLGASHVVDHRDDPVAGIHRFRPDGVDAVLHLAGDVATYVPATVDGGRIVSLVGADDVGVRGITTTSVSSRIDIEQLSRIGEAAATGALRIPIHGEYMLDEVPQAFDDFDAGKLGKLVIEVD